MPWQGAEADFAVHLVRQFTGDRQAQPGTCLLTTVRAVCLRKFAEDLLLKRQGDAVALINHADGNLFAIKLGLDPDDASSW